MASETGLTAARRSALAGVYRAGRFPGPDGRCGVRLRQWTPRYLALVEGAAEGGGAAADRHAARFLWAGVPESGFRALPLGPGRWWVVGLAAGVRPAPAELRSLFPPGAPAPRVCDLGHARVAVQLAGPAALDLLARGSPLDLERLPAGHCAAGVLGPVHAVLHRLEAAPDAGAREEGGFDLYLPRSQAVSAWEWLLEAAREFGAEVLEPDLPTV